MLPQDILQALYDSEINCRIESFWDGGWTGWLGDAVKICRFRDGHYTADEQRKAAEIPTA